MYCDRFSMSASDSVRGDAGHVAGIVGPPSRLEVGQLLLDVLRPLAGDARNLVLADEAAEVAHRAEHRVGNLAARLDLGGVGLELDRRLLLRGEKLAEQRSCRRSRASPPSATSAGRCGGLP